jgi:hypothetical protein
MTEALAATQAQLESLEKAALVQVACRGHITAAAAHRLYHPIGTVATAQSCRGHITAAAAHRLYHPIGTVATAQSCRGHITAAAAHRLHPIGTVATAQSGPDTIRAVCTVLCVYHREAVG